jgi:hypothetical protein
VYGAVQLSLVAFGLNRDVLERGVGRRTGVQVVTDVPYIGVDDAFLNLVGTLSPTPDGRVQFHVTKLNVLKVPLKGLLGGFEGRRTLGHRRTD